MTAQRHDADTASWPLRPWLMAALCAAAGLLVWSLGSWSWSLTESPWRLAAITFTAIAAVSFALTVERRRWSWSLGFAVGWGGVIALVGWFTVRYNQNPTIFEWPFLAGMFAVLLAAPLFQTLRDEGGWHFPYARLHGHAWADAVIGAAALAFVGVAFLLALLISGLFQLIGIKFFWTLLNAGWFDWSLGGFAFGSAVGLLRERDALVATLQRLVMVVLSVLAPVLAAALTLFIASLPFTGLGILWRSSLSTTPLMLTAGAGAILLANAVIGNGRDDRASNRVLLVSAMALALAVLPLALIAAVSLAARITQYGWTPERMWGVVAIGVALAYGLAGGWSVARARRTSMIFCARSRPGWRWRCARWPCCSRCRSSISARFRRSRRLRDWRRGGFPQNASTGAQWRSSSGPPAASGSARSPAPVRPISAASRRSRWRPRSAMWSNSMSKAPSGKHRAAA